VVFGKANQLSNPDLPSATRAEITATLNTAKFDAVQRQLYERILDLYAAGRLPESLVREEIANAVATAGFDKTRIESSLDMFYLRVADTLAQKDYALGRWEREKETYERRVAAGERGYEQHLETLMNARSKKWFGDTEPMRLTRGNLSNAPVLAWVAFFDILIFFGVLLVGFAYCWTRGDLNWVRSLAAQEEG
jgi:hypothetical protein